MKYPKNSSLTDEPDLRESKQQNINQSTPIQEEVDLQDEHQSEQQHQLQIQDEQETNKDKSNRGVVYMSRIPPFMTPNQVRKLLSQFSLERIYLLPETNWVRQNRVKKGGSKRICFREGWIQFTDKKVARMVALALNGQKMAHKKSDFYSQDLWNLKYLPKFKWHNLTERLAHEQRLKKERLRVQLEQERKVQEFYSSKVEKSKFIKGIVKKKEKKSKKLMEKVGRSAKQLALLREDRN